MELHGVFGDVKAGGDLLVAGALGQQREDIDFAGGERLSRGQVVGAGQFGRGGQKHLEDFGGEDGEAIVRGLERGGDFARDRDSRQRTARAPDCRARRMSARRMLSTKATSAGAVGRAETPGRPRAIEVSEVSSRTTSGADSRMAESRSAVRPRFSAISKRGSARTMASRPARVIADFAHTRTRIKRPPPTPRVEGIAARHRW